jgi:adenylate kinase family enzyme
MADRRSASAAMKRVAVVGSGGAGKSTFARSLGAATHLPVVHLDEHYWHPGWVETPREEWRVVQSEMAAHEQWIIEGNYRNTFDIRFDRADTVIVLGPARSICIYRALKRVLRNWHQPTQAPGCPEHFDWSFLTWVWRFPYDARPQLDEALLAYRGRFEVVELSTRRDVRRYLDAAR